MNNLWTFPTDVGLRSEEELILFCAPHDIAPERSERIAALLEKGIDWDYLLRTTLRHRVLPAVCRTLQSVCPDAVPPNVLDTLRRLFSGNAARNLWLARELRKVLSFFEARRIRAIPFKGPAFAASIYGSLALRQFADLDILVCEQEYEQAKRLLIAEGFRPTIEHDWETELEDERGSFAVDLHKRMAPRTFPLHLDFEYLWSRLQSITLAGASTRTLCADDTLLALSIQIAKDGLVDLSKVFDIAELAVRQRGNLKQAMQTAKRLGAQRLLRYALHLTSDLLGTALPPEVDDPVSFKSRIAPLIADRRRRVFHQNESSDVQDRRVLASLRWVLEERAWDKLHFRYFSYARDVLTPCEFDRQVLPLSRRFEFLYYFIRPIRLMRKYALPSSRR